MKVMHVVGARPNFMKIAPIITTMAQYPHHFEQVLVHTGQHYDENMSEVFFTELELPQPDFNLGVGSGSHAWQTAQVLMRFEAVVMEQSPDWVIVVGDVNSTMACTLVSSKLKVPVAHVEAGLRSFDRTMPEEINRLVTDQIADLLFTHSVEANENLRSEGVADEKIHFVGNVMIDTLIRLLPKAEARWPGLKDKFQVDRFVLVTLHRPFNVDDPQTLRAIVGALETVGREVPVIFPAHPRTRKVMVDHGIQPTAPGLIVIDPLSYLDFIAMEAHAALVVTDSGGVQEETTYLGIPCLTARPNTERPVTVSLGTNQLVPSEQNPLTDAMFAKLQRLPHTYKVPPLWDGRAAERIADVFLSRA